MSTPSSSQQTGPSKKRPHSQVSQASECPSKRLKISEPLLESARMVNKALQTLRPRFQEAREMGINLGDFGGYFLLWGVALDITLTSGGWSSTAQGYLDLRLPVPEDASDLYASLIVHANSLFAEYSDLQKEAFILADDAALPSPSMYGKKNIWPSVQEKTDRILCFRPTKRDGLPLSTLHTIFSVFQALINQPVPNDDPTGIAALQAASALCKEMGNSFENEGDRGNEFDACTSNLFTWFHMSKSTINAGGIPDRMYYLKKDRSIPGAIREDKLELGEAESDAYLQTARSYDILVNHLRGLKIQTANSFLKCGAPMFLLSVIGPLFFVAGGFFDGKSVTVEPLTEAVFMLGDYTGRRQRILAQLLYALQVCMQTLSRTLGGSPAGDFPPAVPRRYASITSPVSGLANTLTFDRPMDHGTVRQPMFFATLLFPIKAPPESVSVVVKLVSRSYGDQVHKLLSDYNLAPRYYGSTALSQAPTAHVMEYLPKETWISLFEFEHSNSANVRWKDVIWRRLNEALKVMAKDKVVHGDLRSNNIFIEIDQVSKKPVLLQSGLANIKILDFDWAGKAGEVRYPVDRNECIEDIEWPDSVGAVIGSEHDRQLVDSWWPAYLFQMARDTLD